MESSASTDTHLDGSDKGTVVSIMSPRRGKPKKPKKHATQSQLSIGRKSNKLIITMPTGETDSSSPHHGSKSSPQRKDSKQKDNRSPSPILIDSDESVPTTRSSKKRKSVQEEDVGKKKQKTGSSTSKKTSSASKTGCAKGNVKKREEETSTSEENTVFTFEEFMKDPDINKWRYVVDVISDKDIEAIQILIDERRLAEEEKERKDIEKQQKKAMKEFRDSKVNIKSERQRDCSCDKMETGSLTDSSSDKRKTCWKEWSKEFYVYTFIGNQKRMLKLVKMDSTEGRSSESLRNFVPERSDMQSVATTSDACGGDIDTDGMTTANETDQEMKEVSQDSGLDTESSIVELEINKKPIVYHSVDTDSDTGNGKKDNGNNQSTSTDKIFTSFQSGDMMSISSASEFNGGDSPETIELSSDCTSEKTKESEAPEPTDKQQNSTVTPTDLKEDEKKDDGTQQNDNDAVSTKPAEDDKDEVTKEDLMKTERRKSDVSMAEKEKTGDAPEKQESVPDVPMPEKEKTDSSLGNGTNSVAGDAPEKQESVPDVPMPEKEKTDSSVGNGTNNVTGDAPEKQESVPDVPMPEKEKTDSSIGNGTNSVAGDAPKKQKSVPDVPMAEKKKTFAQKSVAADAPIIPMSAADVPTPVKEMTFTQKLVATDAPVIPISAADVPTPVKEMTSVVPNVPTSETDVPTDSTVPQSPSVATPHESVVEKISSEGDVPTNATDSPVPLTDSMAQTSQKEYKDAFGHQGEIVSTVFKFNISFFCMLFHDRGAIDCSNFLNNVDLMQDATLRCKSGKIKLYQA